MANAQEKATWVELTDTICTGFDWSQETFPMAFYGYYDTTEQDTGYHRKLPNWETPIDGFNSTTYKHRKIEQN